MSTHLRRRQETALRHDGHAEAEHLADERARGLAAVARRVRHAQQLPAEVHACMAGGEMIISHDTHA